MNVYLIPIHIYLLALLSMRGSRKRPAPVVDATVLMGQYRYYETLKASIPTDNIIGKITIGIIERKMREIDDEIKLFMHLNCQLFFIPIVEDNNEPAISDAPAASGECCAASDNET